MYRHNDGLNVNYIDGHAKWKKGPIQSTETNFWVVTP
jgi:prepilin-type processing-associated H-X9-DG protein